MRRWPPILLLLLLLPGCALFDREAVALLRGVQGSPAAVAPQREVGPEADLWRPGDAPPRAALLLVPGFSEEGRADPRLLPVAAGLAASGFLVLVPDLPGARRLTLDPRDIAALDAAARRLAAHPDNPRPGGTGMAAVSYAAGPALLAAAAPGSPVRLLVTIGGYHDIEAAATAAATGAWRRPGETAWQPGTPNRLARAAFLLALAARLDHPGDLVWLRTTVARLLAGADAPAPVPRHGSTRAGQAAIALAFERDPDRIPERLAALPPAAREVLAALDPARQDLRALPACVVALHGKADPVVPWPQSVAIAGAVPRSRLVLVPGFSHIDGPAIPIEGRVRLAEAARALLDWRDGADPCAG
jgi:pimeloyl-ACP methyl ester carboxylesterase